MKNKLLKKLRNGMIGIGIAGAVLFGGCDKKDESQKPNNTTQIRNSQQSMRESILSYMAKPGFVNKNFTKQITKTDAKLKLHNLDERKLYFSIPKDKYFTGTLEKITKNQDSVEFGRENRGRINLGDYIFRNGDYHIFRINSEDFKVNPKNNVRVNFGEINYTASPKELADFIENKNDYNGNLYVKNNSGYFLNHMAYVVNGKEPSLERLTNQITNENDPNELKSQKLLDFVTNKIEYNKGEAARNFETLKRSSEALMSGNSDCSGKTILYASLLEQENVDYKLVYFMNGKLNHIAIGVNGDFPNYNNLGFNLGQENYSIAETTCKNFKIGKTGVDCSLNEITYLQSPGKNSKPYNAKTGESLEFLK